MIPDGGRMYHDADTAKTMFKKFDKCREVYKKLYLTGRTMLQMTVVA